MMLANRIFHDVAAPVLYQNLTVHIRHYPRRIGVPWRFNPRVHLHSSRLLPCLMLSTKNASPSRSHRCYVRFIVRFTFKSQLSLENIRAIPMFVDILRFTTSLQFLRIDICDESVPTLLDLMRRKDILRRSTLPPMLIDPHASLSTPLYLPSLKGFRTSSPEIAIEFLRLRPTQVLAIEDVIKFTDLNKLSDSLATASTTRLRSLSLTIENFDVVAHAVTLQVILVSLPSLEYLSIRTTYPMWAMEHLAKASTSRALFRTLLMF